MFRRLKAGIARTRDGLARGINRLFAESARLDAKALEELENVLLSHPEVIEAAVLGWPHKSQGEVAVAFVARRSESLDDEAIIAYCRERIAGHKLPHIITYLPELPRNPMGKVLKGPLRAQLIEDMKSRMPDEVERSGET